MIKPRARAAHRREKFRRMMRLQISHAVRNVRVGRRMRLAKAESREFLDHHPGLFARCSFKAHLLRSFQKFST